MATFVHSGEEVVVEVVDHDDPARRHYPLGFHQVVDDAINVVAAIDVSEADAIGAEDTWRIEHGVAHDYISARLNPHSHVLSNRHVACKSHCGLYFGLAVSKHQSDDVLSFCAISPSRIVTLPGRCRLKYVAVDALGSWNWSR